MGTNRLLHKINNTHTDKCSFCKDSIETIEHLFWECTHVQNLLINFETILDEHNINFSYNKRSFIMGYTDRSINIPKNLILLWLKYYIFKIRMQGKELNINAALNYIRSQYTYHKTSFQLNNDAEVFEKNWKLFTSLFS